MNDVRFLLKPNYSNSRALIIGIDEYKSASPLHYAVSDAKEVREAIIEELEFPSANITYLADEQATKEKILKEFLKFTTQEVDVDERLIIFFAGHGHTRTGHRGEVGYLVPYDADMNDFSTFIRWDDLTRNADLIRAKHILFIMDACYGGLALNRHLNPGSTRFLRDMMRRFSRQVLTAGKADEVVSDSGGPIPNHSVFTGHLLEGLRGNAFNSDGILTASGLMSYVYGKVANDKNSRQTPHYGHFDGDGDFVLKAPNLSSLENEENTELDRLIVVPFPEETTSMGSTANKVARVKKLLAVESSAIELHDLAIDEVRRFLSSTGDDNFATHESFSKEELISRLARYEDATLDLALISCCISYWARPAHEPILRKIIARSTDRLDSASGLNVWIGLRWYPMILELYCAGIAAISADRYDALATIFFARVDASDREHDQGSFVGVIASKILDLTSSDVFKQLPAHAKHYTPMSEYLFKFLQPALDDTLFIGKDYERSFDDFEVLLALTTGDIRSQRDRDVWGPVGRFGWKHKNRHNPPLTRLISEAKELGQEWPPLKAGLFGGDCGRFLRVASDYEASIARLSWW